MSNAGSGKCAKVVFEYDPVEEDELRLAVGDRITDVEIVEDGWMRGTLNGRRGVFPDNFVEVFEAAEKPQQPNVGAVAKKKYCKVTFAYTADGGDELTINIGDILEIVNEPEDGWFEGVRRGKKGVFPSNFVELIDEQTALKALGRGNEKASPPLSTPASTAAPSTAAVNGGQRKSGGDPSAVARAKVLFEYKAEAPDELDLKVGSIIEITSKDISEGWWEGKINGRIGVFPDNFVELLPMEVAKKKEKEGPKPLGVPVLPFGGKPSDLLKKPAAVPDKAEKEPLKTAPPAKSPTNPLIKPVLKPVPATPSKPTPLAGNKPQVALKKVLPKEEREKEKDSNGPFPGTDFRSALRPTPSPGSKPRPEPPGSKPKPFVEKPKPSVPSPAKPLNRPQAGSGKAHPLVPAEEKKPKPMEEKAKTEEINLPDDPLSLDAAAQPLTHLTATRAKRQNKRPPGRFAKKIANAEAARKAEPEESKPAKEAVSGMAVKDVPAKVGLPKFKSEKPGRPASKADPAMVDLLRDEITQMAKKMKEMESYFKDRIEALETKLDDHKKERAMLQVELERLARRASKH